jgi:hypothetical protein
VPFWLGSLGAEKWRVVPEFLERAANARLVCDLSYREEDRLYGERWIRFLSSCKAMLGVESGAIVFDFSGRIQSSVEEYVRRKPEATFEEVRELFFAEEEGRIRLNQISPRCFEAAALRTAMVLFEGTYSGILSPWDHYIPLKKNFSNFQEVAAALRDDDGLQRMVDRTYLEIARNPRNSYRQFIEEFDAVLSECYAVKRGAVRAAGYSPKRFWLLTAAAATSAAVRFPAIPLKACWARLPTWLRSLVKGRLSCAA